MDEFKDDTWLVFTDVATALVYGWNPFLLLCCLLLNSLQITLGWMCAQILTWTVIQL